MLSKPVRAGLTVLVLCVGYCAPVCHDDRAYGMHNRRSNGNDLFYNFYAGPPLGAGSASAGLYPAPLPTPPHVGHTYITYQPMMPHEFLYRHHRHYYHHEPGRGWVRTKVYWKW